MVILQQTVKLSMGNALCTTVQTIRQIVNAIQNNDNVNNVSQDFILMINLHVFLCPLDVQQYKTEHVLIVWKDIY